MIEMTRLWFAATLLLAVALGVCIGIVAFYEILTKLCEHDED